MRELVFLLEELSAREMLESLLRRIIDPSITVRYITFDGKSDLEKNLTTKIRAYANPSAKFIVMRDQDSAPDCRVIKERLMDRCRVARRPQHSMIRIACRELESFYLGDLAAVSRGLEIPGLEELQRKAKFRIPDNLQNPCSELVKLTNKKYQKVSGSREIGKYLDCENNRSLSFRHLIAGIKKLEIELLALTP